MPITRAALESELIEELGPIIGIVGLDAVTKDGSNESLAGPIRKAIIASGGSIADPPAVSDADVQTATAPFETIMLYARLAMLKKAWGNWHHVDMKSGEETQMLNQLAKRITDEIAAIEESLRDPEAIAAQNIPGPPIIGQIGGGISSGSGDCVYSWKPWNF